MDCEVEIPLGPEWLQKVLVVSHERSGTHFLMNTLAQNFHYVSTNRIDVDENLPINFWDPNNLKRFIGNLKGLPIASIFKSHHPIEFWEPVFEVLMEEFFVFYIHRNPTDVMNSYCKHFNRLTWHAGPRCKDGEELAKAEPTGGMLRYQWVQHKTCYDRWKSHVDGWMTRVPEKYSNRVIYVTYEELNEHFNETVESIGNRIGMTPPHHPIRPVKGINVI